MLEQIAHFNDLSPELRKKLQDRIGSFGETVKYRFDIERENPDPEKYNGKTIFPAIFTLDPIVFDIIDNLEKREDKSRAKKIGIVTNVDEKGIPNRFGRVRIHGKDKGVKTFDLTNPAEVSEVMFLELHPKVNGSLFQDKKRVAVVTRIDEEAEAKTEKERRDHRKKALLAADKMNEKQVKEFAAAMKWDENEKPAILRNKVEKMADETPELFNDLINSDAIKYQTIVSRALSANIIGYDPVNGRYVWSSNQMLIATLGVGDPTKNEVELFAEYLRTGGQKADEIFKKIESLLKV